MPIFYLDSGSIDRLEVSSSLLVSGTLTVTGSLLSQGGFTGSLFGTASWANNINFDIVAGGVTDNNVSQLVFSNSNNASFGINAGTITVSAPINFSGGTTSNNLSQLVFSNANNISFGLNAGTLTATVAAGAGGVESYFANIPLFQGSGNTLTLGGSSNHVQPFMLPYDISIGYIRVLLSNAFAATSFGTTANTNIALQQTQTFFANIYSQGTGANSRSLQQIAGSSATMTMRISGSIGAASNNQTVFNEVGFPVTGNTTSFATTYNVNSTSIVFSSTQFTQFNSNRFLDIPFATSLAAGNYWIALQKSIATATTGLTAMTSLSHANSFYYATQINSNFAEYGNASNVSTNQILPGLGYWSTNSSGGTSVSLALSHISTVASQIQIPFQMIRFA